MDMLEGETIDFARLPFRVQEGVIRQVQATPRDRLRLLELNPKLRWPATSAEERIAANAAVVNEHFSLSHVGANLAGVYGRLMAVTPSSQFDALMVETSVLDFFLQLDRLHAIRIEA